MIQLIGHLIGDYWLQTSWMAFNKEKSWVAALCHAFVYMTPFYLFANCGLIEMSVAASAVMFGTHVVIDRFGIMKGLCLHLNPGLKQAPESLNIWIPIVWDNTAHLTINYFALTLL